MAWRGQKPLGKGCACRELGQFHSPFPAWQSERERDPNLSELQIYNENVLRVLFLFLSFFSGKSEGVFVAKPLL